MRSDVRLLYGGADMARGLVIVAVAFGLLVHIDLNLALGCSCAWAPPREHFAQSEYVFAGVVTQREVVEEENAAAKHPVVNAVYTFDVTHVWKGDITERVVVSSAETRVCVDTSSFWGSTTSFTPMSAITGSGPVFAVATIPCRTPYGSNTVFRLRFGR